MVKAVAVVPALAAVALASPVEWFGGGGGGQQQGGGPSWGVSEGPFLFLSASCGLFTDLCVVDIVLQWSRQLGLRCQLRRLQRFGCCYHRRRGDLGCCYCKCYRFCSALDFFLEQQQQLALDRPQRLHHRLLQRL